MATNELERKCVHSHRNKNLAQMYLAQGTFINRRAEIFIITWLYPILSNIKWQQMNWSANVFTRIGIKIVPNVSCAKNNGNK